MVWDFFLVRHTGLNSFCFVRRKDLGSVIALAGVFALRGPERVPIN
jgi:hypothetical protein